ncbi:hypothetical protein Plhal703r1_c04g0022031 [Plasmopara halstedii]
MSADLWSPTYRGIIFLVLTFSLVVCFTFYMPAPEDASAQSGQRFLKQMVPYDPNQNEERFNLESARNALSDLQMRFTIDKYELAKHLIAESKINPLQANFLKTPEFFQVADKITDTFFFESRSAEAILLGLIHAAGDEENKMLESLARSIGEFEVMGEMKVNPFLGKAERVSEEEKAKRFNRLREIVLALEPHLLNLWMERGVSPEQAQEILQVDFSSTRFLDNSHLSVYIHYLDMTPRYKNFGLVRILLLETEKHGVGQHQILLKLLDLGALTKPESFHGKILDSIFLYWDRQRVDHAQLYKILVPDLSIGIEFIEDERLVESKNGVERVAFKMKPADYMPPIPQRDKQLADVLALKLFGTAESSYNKINTHFRPSVRPPTKQESIMIFTEDIFEGLRKHWSRHGLTPDKVFSLMDLDKLTDEQLLSSLHLWTFLWYTTEHLKTYKARGKQMFDVLKRNLNDEEIVKLLGEMNTKEYDIFVPLSLRMNDHWNSRDESLVSLTKTLDLEIDPLSNPKIIPVFYHCICSGKTHLENILLMREFMATKYPEENIDYLLVQRQLKAKPSHKHVLAELCLRRR